MSAIQIDNGYLIINADADKANRAVSAINITEDDLTCEITFDTEKAAEDAMYLLAEALCGKWQDGASEELLT